MIRTRRCNEPPASATWDAVVIGAGPTGAVAARQSARAGFRTLLVDKQAFPRFKVCGGCLNGRAISVLRLLGMHSCFEKVPAVSLNALAIHCGQQQATLRLNGGKAIARSVLDHALVKEAQMAGSKWLPETLANVGEVSNDGTVRFIELTRVGQQTSRTVRARIVLVADGLSSSSLQWREDDFEVETHPASRVGLGGVLHDAPADYAAGTIHMAVAQDGYVGIVRLDDNSLNIAAAVDSGLLRERASVHSAVAKIISESASPTLELRNVRWKGTPQLTRRMDRPVAERVLVLGDAAGYVEPFTGEGMAWAILSGAAAATFVPDGLTHWTSDLETKWIRTSRQLVRKHQFTCRVLARVLRSYRLTSAATQLFAAAPFLAAPIVARTSKLPSHVERFVKDSMGKVGCSVGDNMDGPGRRGARAMVPSTPAETPLL